MRPGKTRRSIAMACGVAGLLAWAGPVCGEMDPSLGDALAALDSDDFAVREAATMALATDPDVADAQLASLMRDASLSAEQQSRLYSVLFERFMRSSRGAIGITFAAAGGTVVGEVSKGFPSGDAGLLKPMDEILEVEGHPVTGDGGRETLRWETCSREPGEILRMRIARSLENGQRRELDLEVTLGTVDAFDPQKTRQLNGRVFTDLDRLRGFNLRMAREGIGPTTRSYRPGVGEESWGELEQLNRAMARRSGAARASRMVAGPVDSGFALIGTTRFVINNNGRAMIPRARIARADDAEIVEARARQIALMRAQANQRQNANIRVQIGGGGGGGGALVPEEIGAQRQMQRAEIARQQLLAKRRMMDNQREINGGEDPRVTVLPDDAIETANRLAARIGRLEGQVAEQERLLRTGAGTDAGIQRMAEERIAELRATLGELEDRLRRTMADAGQGEADAEASAWDE